MEDKRARVPSIYIRRAVDAMVSRGASCKELLRGTGIDPASLTDPAMRFSFEQQRKVFEGAISHYGAHDLGLVLGRQLKIYDHGVYGYAMMTAPSVHHALVVLVRFLPLGGSPVGVKLIETGTELRLIATDSEPMGRARQVFIDELFTALYLFLKAVTDGRFRAKSLQLDCDKPPYAHRYRDVFDCPVLFGKPSCQLIVSRARARLPITSSDPETSKVCKQRCSEILERMRASEEIVDRVRETLLRLPCNHRHADYVAAELGMSSRHMRRKLNGEETSFQTVLDNVRFELSKDYLLQTKMPLEEIAPLVGYTELTNFRRAFKKWSGQTPSAFRSAQ